MRRSSSLSVLLTRPLQAGDIGAFQATDPRERNSATIIMADHLLQRQQASVPRRAVPGTTKPDLALKAARHRHAARFGVRPASTAEDVTEAVRRHVNLPSPHSASAPKVVASAMEPTTDSFAADNLPALLARNLHYELCVRGEQIDNLRLTIARLLKTLPLLEAQPDPVIRDLADAVVLRQGERYGRLYSFGTEVHPHGKDGFAYILLSGAAAASEEGLRSKATPVHARADSYGPGECCGLEMLTAPPPKCSADPLVPRSQTCLWTTPGAALALPLAALASAPLAASDLRPLHVSLCAQLLLALLPGRDARAPEQSAIEHLCAAATLRRCAPGNVLFLSGSKTTELLFLVRGRVELSGAISTTHGVVSPEAAFAMDITLRREPGPLGAHALLSESLHAGSARVAVGQTSALIIKIPVSHARAAIQRSPNLRTAILLHASPHRPALALDLPRREASNPATASSTKPDSQRSSMQRPATAGPSAGRTDVSQGVGLTQTLGLASTAEARYMPTWTRARVDHVSRIALMEASAGPRKDGIVPWTVMISQILGDP